MTELQNDLVTTDSTPKEVGASNDTKLPPIHTKRKPTRLNNRKNGSLAESIERPADWELKAENEGLLEVDLNTSRRKRRKTTTPIEEPISIAQLDSEQNNGDGLKPRGRPRKNTSLGKKDVDVQGANLEHCASANEATQNLTPDPIPIDLDQNNPEQSNAQPRISLGENMTAYTEGAAIAMGQKIPSMENSSEKRTRILRFNPKTGTIGSPPAKNVAPAMVVVPRVSRKSRVPHIVRSMVITIPYGEDEELPASIGPKIDHILNGKPYVQPIPEKTPAKPLDIDNKCDQTIHPLFLSKATKAAQRILKKSVPTQNIVVDLTQLKTTPPKNRLQPNSVRSVLLGNLPMLKLGQSKATGKQFYGFCAPIAKTLRFPGAVEPAWPWKGMVHVRGTTLTSNGLPPPTRSVDIPPRIKKSKDHAAEVHGNEDIISTLAVNLDISHAKKSVQVNADDEVRLPPVCLRAPVKYNESGLDLQKRVRKELVHKMPPLDAVLSSSDDELSIEPIGGTTIHPVLSKTYLSIATSLSAFDQGQCETHAWIHKYSPSSAVEVLQTGREPLILKEWLQTLTVQSVEGGLGDKSKRRELLGSKQPKVEGAGKRKRKPKLDGFVVSSGDEDDDMDEISEPENETPVPGRQGSLRKTVVRAGDLKSSKDGAKMTNAVVLSGPHGVGKTAAVYAVAKELNFEVFEINSSSRRSGKDILEKVGDMTRNHLVQTSSRRLSVDTIDEDRDRIDDALEEDLRSGRQGTMNSFFKPKPPSTEQTKSKPGARKPVVEPKKPAEQQEIITKPQPKDQKQSLILIEEADIIFKEDVQFWATIMGLISTSKRPIIMTCNDESALPMQNLSLHAIIRFNPPPTDIAADYLLLIAACEGHILTHQAVKALYESRGLDLRASITELNFWCQFAVADPKGGLDWYLEHWPPGCSIDKNGNTIRVVSEGTYQTGMGWLSQDFIESHLHHLDIEEEMLHEVWDGWCLDAGDWQQRLEMKNWADEIPKLSTGRDGNRAALDMYCEFAEYMSIIDLFSNGAFASENNVAIDTSQPKVSAKVREDYTLASELLEAFPLVNYSTLSKDISIFMKSRARKFLQVDSHIAHNLEVPIQLDRPSETQILNLICQQAITPAKYLTRHDFSLAFDPISEAPKTTYVWTNTPTLEASSFDRTLTPIVEDLAPYVRSIVAYDKRLLEERKKLSGLLSEGGQAGRKRMRTTRAAMSALEGGERRNTRKEKWFAGGLNASFVEKTGKEEWIDIAVAQERIAKETIASENKAKIPENSGDSEEHESTSSL